MKHFLLLFYSLLFILFLQNNALAQGDSCANAIQITSLPFSYTGTTCGYGCDYDSSICNNHLYLGDDIVFAYTPLQDENIYTTLIADSNEVGIIATNGCPTPISSTCIGIALNNFNNVNGSFTLLSGNTYYFVIFREFGCMNFTIDFTLNIGGGNCSGGPSCTYPIPTAHDNIQQTPLINHPVICGNVNNTYTAASVPSMFCGSVENNSWLKFNAASDTAIFNIYICNCENGDGIQMEIYSTTDFQFFYSYSNCWNPGSQENGIITATGLTIGETYYIMLDGYAGDICDYTLTAESGVEIDNAWIEQTGNSFGILNQSGGILNLQAYGGTIYNWSPITGLSNPYIANPTANIDTSITYTCAISDGSKTQISSDVTIAVITHLTSIPTSCNDNTYNVSGELTFNGIPDRGYITIKDNIGINQIFHAPFSNPLPYTFSNLPANGTIHTVTASFCDLNNNQLIVSYIAPSGCTSCTANAGPDIATCGLSAQLQAIDSVNFQSRNWTSLQAGVVFSNNQSATSQVTVPVSGSYSFVWQTTNDSGLVCSDTVSYTFNPLPQTPFISFDNTTLTSNASTGNQWYNQNGIIVGATNPTLTPAVSGTYYCIVEENGCSSGQSNSINVVITGINTPIETPQFTFYPNPANEKITLEFSKNNFSPSVYYIYNSAGQQVLSGKAHNTQATILTTNLSEGIYSISVINEKWIKNVKLIIKK